MHYDRTRRLSIPIDQVTEALRKNPIDRTIALRMFSDGVRVEFRQLSDGNTGIANLDVKTNIWCITADDRLGIDATEEVIWHELVHLHLRRFFGGFLRTEHDSDVHGLITNLGAELGRDPPVSYQELMWYCRPHE